MGWSTSQLAELAGTTLRTIRHYHDVGLLPEPGRKANGYKSYGVTHLVRVLRIKRLTDLGLSLTQIAGLGDGDEHPGEALRELDAELAATVERLQRVRGEIAVILRQEAPTDLPPEIAATLAHTDLSPQDRAFTVVMAQLLTPDALSSYAEVLKTYARVPVLVEFDELPEDADEETRQDLADRMRVDPLVREMQAAFPDPTRVRGASPHSDKFVAQTIVKTIAELYNKAQLDVLVRMNG